MKNRDSFINEKELQRTIKLLKGNKATDESCMIGEYVKALGDQDLNNLMRLLNDVLMGGCIPKEWKESRVVLVHKGGSKNELKNYRPVAIINVVYKLFMMVLRERINGWVEESGMLGDIHGGFRMGRRTEDNLFMLERMIEMAKVRKDCLFVAFIDIIIIIIIIFIRINNYTYRVHIKHLSTNYIKIFRIENKLYYNNYFYKIIVIQYNI